MSGDSPAPTRSGRRIAARVLAAGTVAALLDALFGIVYYVVLLDLISTGRFFQSIASGLLGRQAYSGGAPTVVLGAVLHLAIGCIWATAYHLAVRASPGLRRRVRTAGGALAAGAAFGVVIWLVMDLVVLPLSAARPTPVTSPRFAIQLLAHMLLVGPPIAWLLRPRENLATR